VFRCNRHWRAGRRQAERLDSPLEHSISMHCSRGCAGCGSGGSTDERRSRVTVIATAASGEEVTRFYD
jgi:hypothetical protein